MCVLAGGGDVLKVKVCNDDGKWWFPYKDIPPKIWLSDMLSWVGEQHKDGHAYRASNGLCWEGRAAAPACQASGCEPHWPWSQEAELGLPQRLP